MDVTFRPFDAQYSGFLEKIQHHCAVLEEEQMLMQTKVLVQTQEQQKKGFERQQEREKEYEKFQREMEKKLANAQKREEICKPCYCYGIQDAYLLS
jgi:hypothetical protein